jgi:hypothetical protein
MLGESLAFLDSPVDLITARVPSADACAVSGLQNSGFKVVSGEAVAVARSPRAVRIRLNGTRIVPLHPEHLEAALEIACDCRQCNPFLGNPGLGRNRICRLSRLNLKPYLHDSGQGGMVALDHEGKVSGFAAYSLDAVIANSPDRRVASMDQLCVAAEGKNGKLSRTLGRYLLKELGDRGVEAVITRTFLNGAETDARVESLRKIGFQVTQSNLVMHRWLAETQAWSA